MKRAYQISRRLKEWGVEEFGSLVGLARAVGISQQSLYDYTSGRTLPGNKMQARLRSVGCDVEWLMTGAPSGAPAWDSSSGGVPAVSWARFEGRVVGGTDGRESWDRTNIVKGAGIPYRRGNFFCLEFVSDALLSAEPLPVYPGDICIFEADRQPKNGDIVAVRLKRLGMLVRVVNYVTRHEIDLCPANKYRDYPTIRVKKSDVTHLGVLKSVMQTTIEEKRIFGLEP